MKYFFIFIFIFLSIQSLSARSLDLDSLPLAKEQKKIEIRSFDQNQVKDLQNDKSFVYDQKSLVKTSFLNWLFSKILEFLATIFGSKIIGKIVLIILIIIVISGLGFFGYGLFKTGKTSPMFRPPKSPLGYEVTAENIFEINFPDEIEDALKKKEYRKAVRLLYLQALKTLAESDLIEWKPWKTNHEYMFELKADEVKKSFIDLSYYFDYVWYGDFSVSYETYSHVHENYNVLSQLVKKRIEA